MDSTSSAELVTRIQDILASDPTLRSIVNMDDDDGLSTPGSPVIESTNTSAASEDAILAKQRDALLTYTNSVPYTCESPEEMDSKLEHIVDMIYIATKSNQLDIQREWDGVLSTWLLMKYPISKTKRIKFLQCYYELCVIPAEFHLVNDRVKMFQALLPHRRDSVVSLDAKDLVLDWRPLWRILKKELWPMRRLLDPSRNVANVYLALAEMCKRFFPGGEVKSILSTILPLLMPETFLSIVPVLTSFIPLSNSQDYLPALFAIWEAFNSNIVDERMIELMSELAEEHVGGLAGPLGEGGSTRWNDVGIWSDKQWVFITGKCLGSMNVPVGGAKGASTTGGHADLMGVKNALRIKKPINKNHSLAKLIVYSMSVDGPARSDAAQESSANGKLSQPGFLAGCKALDSLEKIITSAETFFHPSNTGHWTLNLSNFLQRLASEFCKRWKEEEDSKCKTPVTQRLTPTIRRSFVLVLRTPMLLALFAKDPVSMGLAQGALRSMALLEPGLVMPHILERAYGGLEVVNETHRTTAVLSMLSAVALPLISENIWLGGQKHLIPLLELCLPGIDLNDPSKTICATLFICSALQHIKIGDLSMHAQSAGLMTGDDGPAQDALMDVDEEEGPLPDGAEGLFTVYSRNEERALVRDSTAGFADWVTSLFRRVFSLYENLPEEGGRRNTTGGKSEESVLKSIKNMLDVVCLHLSDTLFDLVLKYVYEYATTNTKSNAVRAIGQLVACLARAKPQLTTDKFLPFCLQRIKEELKHGASSTRTTSPHLAVPSDTTLHWNVSLIRGCLGYGGPALLKHKDSILDLLNVLIEKTKSERGFSGSGRLVQRLMHTLSGVYPIHSRLVNTNEWESEEFNKNHNLHWGRFYEVKDVNIEWHVPSEEEISFVLQILDQIVAPLLDRLEVLLTTTKDWNNVANNDFCRYLYAVRSVWAGLPTLFEEPKRTGDPCLKREKDSDIGLQPSGLPVAAGFALTDPRDPRYEIAVKHRERYGRVVHRAAVALRENIDRGIAGERHGDVVHKSVAALLGGNIDGEHHIDAVIQVLKAIDTYLLEYGVSRSDYAALQKNYTLARDINRLWPGQKENTRLVFLKRAQVYHIARLATHSINRCRTKFDTLLFEDLLEFSLSPYTRVRRNSQSVLFATTNSYPLSAQFVFPKMISNLDQGTDPDRMKGALYVLSYKEYRPIIRYDPSILSSYMISLLECQHEDKPSVQKLVSQVHHDLLLHCNSEESLRNLPAVEESSRLNSVLEALRSHFSGDQSYGRVLANSMTVFANKVTKKDLAYKHLTTSIVEIARRQTTHWRYKQMAIQNLMTLLRRDIPQTPDVAQIFIESTTEAQPSTRLLAQRGLVKLLAIVKIRSYAKSDDELWFEEWRNPLQRDVPVEDPQELISFLQKPFSDPGSESSLYVDKITSGFLMWEPIVKAYALPNASSPLSLVWEAQSRPALDVIASVTQDTSYFSRLLSLWAQEDTAQGDLEFRSDNVLFIKTIAKTFEQSSLNILLSEIDPMLSNANRFKQRAGAEAIGGLLRGSKHWPEPFQTVLWNWFMARVPEIFTQIKPDTSAFWESLFQNIFAGLDPRRSKPFIDWVMSLPLEFHSDSAFTMSKTLDLFSTMINEMGIRFGGLCKRYIDVYFENAHTGYAEVRMGIAQCLYLLMACEWLPSYPSADVFLTACANENDPLEIRRPKHLEHITKLAEKLPIWRLQRYPPPRVGQSQFDKVSLTLLSWFWTVGHSSEASTIFPYVIPILPEILKMTELNDNKEVTMYSSGVLFILSAVTPPEEYVEVIADQFIDTIKASSSYKIKLTGLPILTIFFYRNLVSVSESCIARVMDAVISCLSDENIEVRELAAKLLSGLLRCSQRKQILPLRNRFVTTVLKTQLPKRQDPGYADTLRTLHSAILGVCALIESFPYSVESWMPPLAEVLAPHASDPPPIATTIRKCASEFKKTHQDTWHIDQQAFNEDQLQDLSSMLIGTSYYA